MMFVLVEVVKNIKSVMDHKYFNSGVGLRAYVLQILSFDSELKLRN